MLDDSQDLVGYREALRLGELAGPRCDRCQRHWWPPRPACPRCGSLDFTWVTLPRVGVLFTWTVVTHATLPAFSSKVPYAVGVMAFEDLGIRVIGFVDDEPDHLTIGLPMAWNIPADQSADAPPVRWVIADQAEGA